MKKIILSIILYMFFTATIFAQHKISYRVWMPLSCEEGSTSFALDEGSGVEGEEFVIPSYNIPPEYLALGEYFQNLQMIADAFADAKIGIPEGALTEDVEFQIDLTSIQCSPGYANLAEALSFTVKVIGSVSGEHPPFSYYDFANGKEAYVILKLENLLPLSQKFNMGVAQMFAWFANEGLTADLTGIRHELTQTELKIYLSHFSKIVIGTTDGTTDVNLIEQLPVEYKLGQNYPNPFNPTTNISYSLPQSGFTKLTVYNSIGVEVETLVSEIKTAGFYEINFDASDLTSGIYFYDLTSNNFRSTKKMILIK